MGHHLVVMKNNNELEGRALMTTRHSQDLLNILKDLLRQNLASTKMVLFACKLSKQDKWKAL
jgi:hypothetical protein